MYCVSRVRIDRVFGYRAIFLELDAAIVSSRSLLVHRAMHAFIHVFLCSPVGGVWGVEETTRGTVFMHGNARTSGVLVLTREENFSGDLAINILPYSVQVRC